MTRPLLAALIVCAVFALLARTRLPLWAVAVLAVALLAVAGAAAGAALLAVFAYLALGALWGVVLAAACAALDWLWRGRRP